MSKWACVIFLSKSVLEKQQMTTVLIIQEHSLILLSQNLMHFPRDGIKIFRWKWKDFIVAGRCFQV